MKEKRVNLHSGEIYVGENGEEIFTTLGTCVAFCVYDKKKKVGGMVHYLLPNSNMKINGTVDKIHDVKNHLNYGEMAIPALLKEIKNKGCTKDNLLVTILGGNSIGDSDISREIAEANIEIALSLVKKFGLRFTQKTGGSVKGEQILFKLSDGEILVKKAVSSPSIVEKATGFKDATSGAGVGSGTSLGKKVKVLIVDDSYPIRQILRNLLSESTEIEVVGEAPDADEAEKIRLQKKPDVMTLDIHMPNKDGVTYLSELMRGSPLPVIMISDLSIKEAGPVMKALEIGAFDYIQKPGLRELSEVAPRLISTIKAAYEGRKKLIHLHQRRLHHHKVNNVGAFEKVIGFDQRLKLIAIGASTGGTEALREIFKLLPEQTPPIVVVQHMPKLFTAAFANSLNNQSSIEVKEAEHGEFLKNSTAYIAPGGLQMGIHDKGQGFQIYLKDDQPLNRFKPSVDYMFNSIVELNLRGKLNAALLTGMGEDGARGLLALKQEGSYTIAQDESTCVVYGMPKAAVDRNAAVDVLPLDAIAYSLLHSVNRTQKKPA